MRLIDADALKSVEKEVVCGKVRTPYAKDKTAVLRVFEVDEIRNAPTIDAEPLRHGHWIEDEPVKNYPQFVNDKLVAIPARSFHCSMCNAVAYHLKRNFCSYCGAKMDEEVNT